MVFLVLVLIAEWKNPAPAKENTPSKPARKETDTALPKEIPQHITEDDIASINSSTLDRIILSEDMDERMRKRIHKIRLKKLLNVKKDQLKSLVLKGNSEVPMPSKLTNKKKSYSNTAKRDYSDEGSRSDRSDSIASSGSVGSSSSGSQHENDLKTATHEINSTRSIHQIDSTHQKISAHQINSTHRLNSTTQSALTKYGFIKAEAASVLNLIW